MSKVIKLICHWNQKAIIDKKGIYYGGPLPTIAIIRS